MSVHIFTLPSIPWPGWVRRIMEFLRNIAFINFADFAQPECQTDVSEPETVYLLKHFLRQGVFAVLFGVFFAMFLYGMLTGVSRVKNHGTNAMTALFSLSFLLLVQSNASIFDCTTQQGSPARCSNPTYTTEETCPRRNLA